MARKLQLAADVSAQTTMSLAWIAERLKIGSAQYLDLKGGGH